MTLTRSRTTNKVLFSEELQKEIDAGTVVPLCVLVYRPLEDQLYVFGLMPTTTEEAIAMLDRGYEHVPPKNSTPLGSDTQADNGEAGE